MKQSQALDILKSGQNVFLTGSAGTGKTYVLNEYIRYLKGRKVPVAVTASTGIAATHMNGMTIHSWSGIGIKSAITSSNLSSMKTKKYLKEHLEKAQVLIVDEISMLHLGQLNSVNTVLKYFKNSERAFGGIQVVFSGDFFQLPPIGYEPIGQRFAFMSPAWVEAGLAVCYLTEQFRQDDNELNDILNEIRTASLSNKSRNHLINAQNTKLSSKLTPTKLYTHNIDVDRINIEHLDSLGGKQKKFKASTKGNAKILEVFKKSVQAAELIELKVGAKVMFVKNNPEAGYINGSLGEVIDYSDVGFPVVKLLNGKTIVANQDTWSVEDDGGKALATYNQVPLRLAWAITVHKSQGMTLDAAEIDLSKTFEKGQGYVALSRLRNLANLKLLGFNDTAIQVDALALKADKRFQELSVIAEKEYTDSEELASQAKNFVEYCGGITDPTEIEKRGKKLKQKASTKSTYEITKEYVEKGFSISEIAHDRGMASSSIITHLIKLHAQYPKLDLKQYKPKPAQLKKIKPVYDKLIKNKPKDEPVRLTPLFKDLKGEYTFEEIKLALLFL
ncbi:MAG: AAA family ATPase [Flavobacteriales bacterium]|nr:AAA family ATPase [Flavobacteriales bacterium]